MGGGVDSVCTERSPHELEEQVLRTVAANRLRRSARFCGRSIVKKSQYIRVESGSHRAERKAIHTPIHPTVKLSLSREVPQCTGRNTLLARGNGGGIIPGPQQLC